MTIQNRNGFIMVVEDNLNFLEALQTVLEEVRREHVWMRIPFLFPTNLDGGLPDSPFVENLTKPVNADQILFAAQAH